MTLEPCIMCAGAIINSRIKRVVFATKNEQYKNYIFSKYLNEFYLQEKIEVTYGIYEKECRELLQKFFRNIR